MPKDPISFHRMLLQDEVRMGAYRRAIFETVRPGNAVLDAGSGTGILAIFACQAGASRVYAVERGPVIAAARQLAEANGFADRIIFLNRNIHEIELPESVDVIVSELMGKAVLGEAMAEITGWCRDRFLKPGGSMVPNRVDLVVAPCESAEAYSKARMPERDAWGIDFSRLQQYSSNIPVSARVPADALLAPGQVAYSYSALSSPPVDRFDASLNFCVLRGGVFHGLAAWFSSVLAEGIELSNFPPGLSSWDNLVFLLPEPLQVETGTTIAIRLRGVCELPASPTWVWDITVRRDGNKIAKYRQSTFFAWLRDPALTRNTWQNPQAAFSTGQPPRFDSV